MSPSQILIACAAHPSLMGAEKWTYILSRLYGSVEAVGWMFRTWAAGAEVREGRRMAQISTAWALSPDSTLSE